MKKLNELLEMNKQDIERGLQTLKKAIENEMMTSSRLDAIYTSQIQFYVDEVKEVRKAYNSLNNHGLLSNETFKKYDNEIKEFFLSVGKTLIEAQRIVESFK